MKILLLLLVFLLCKEGKSSVSEQSAGSGDFSDIEEDENNTETQSITSDDEYDVYYVNRLFFFTKSPTPSYLEIIVSAQQAVPGGKMPLLPDLDLKTGKFIFFSRKCLHFFTIIFQYFSYGQRINAGAAASTRARSKKGVK